VVNGFDGFPLDRQKKQPKEFTAAIFLIRHMTSSYTLKFFVGNLV
jgi:hypothetical protein